MTKIAGLALALSLPAFVFAGGNHVGGHSMNGHSGHGMDSVKHREMMRIGTRGDASETDRIVEVTMDDTMRFLPETLSFREGETVQFRVRNNGSIRHEMVLGNPSMIAEHARGMRQGMGMDHDDPNMLSLPPGEEGTLIWKFTRAGKFTFACLVPGHFEAGMKGDITVE